MDNFQGNWRVECGPKTALKSRYNWQGIAQTLAPQFERSQAAKAASLPAWKLVGTQMVLDGDALRTIYGNTLNWLKLAKVLFIRLRKNL
jgi:hypothetical protein